jgi:hypothetical protein
VLTPRVLWIRRLEDSPTATVGSFTGLSERFQFLASVVGCSSKTPSSSPNHQASVRWHTVLHRVRLSGAYVGTDSWASPADTEGSLGPVLAAEHMASWLAKLRGLSYQDIHVRVFSTMIDGLLFGLVKGRKGQSLVLQPNGVSFSAPWTGYPDESPLVKRA